MGSNPIVCTKAPSPSGQGRGFISLYHWFESNRSHQMIISENDKWAYIHIPKHGGHAVARWVHPHLREGDMQIMENVDWLRFPVDLPGIEKHSPAFHLKRWMDETGRDWDAYTSFAVLRDPLTRPQSVFTEIHRNSPWARSVAGEKWWDKFSRLDGPDEFVLSGLYDPDGPLYITHRQTWFVEEPFTRKRLVKRLFLMSNFAVEIPRLLGLPGPIPMNHKGQYVPQALSERAQDVIYNEFAGDFALCASVKADIA